MQTESKKQAGSTEARSSEAHHKRHKQDRHACKWEKQSGENGSRHRETAVEGSKTREKTQDRQTDE